MTLLVQAAAVPTPADTSGHRHKNSKGAWVTITDGKHRHADLEARIKALEDYVRKHP